MLQAGLELWAQRGCRVFRPICFAFLAEAYAAADRLELAYSTLEEALRIAANTGERWAEPEIHRLLGDALARGGSRTPAPAVARLEHAISLARAQGSRSFELRATTNLVRILSSQGNEPRWRDRLAEISRAFTEGFDTADLADARAVLAGGAAH
jgi:predicted ATPase